MTLLLLKLLQRTINTFKIGATESIKIRLLEREELQVAEKRFITKIN